MSVQMLLEGEAFTQIELLDYCAKQLRKTGVPEWKKEVFSFIRVFLDPSESQILQKSSGSTGDPKVFTLSRKAMRKSAERTIRYFRLEEGDRVLLSLPLHYIAGKMMLVRALVGGLDLVLSEPSSRPLQHMTGAIRFAAMVPLQIEESLQYGDPLQKISTLLVGGGELHPASIETLATLEKPEVYLSFGMTETYTHFALKRINGRHPDTQFKLLEGVRAALDDRGCLVVEVPGITSGLLVTNDLVEMNAADDGFTWLGRLDNLINSGGIKIIPELLEDQIRECLGLDCLVLSEADRKLGNRLVLVLEFDGDDPPTDRWMEQLRARLSIYELPRRIVCIPALPRTSSMKPDRTRTRHLLLS